MVRPRSYRRTLQQTLRRLCQRRHTGRHCLREEDLQYRGIQGMGRLAQEMQEQASTKYKSLQKTTPGLRASWEREHR